VKGSPKDTSARGLSLHQVISEDIMSADELNLLML